MMTHSPVTLHIGRHKCGTSSIQGFLHQNRSLLAEHGLIYPEPLEGPIAHHGIPMALVRGDDLRGVQEWIDCWRARGPILCSSESFQRVRNLDVLGRLFGGEIKVVVYLREHFSYAWASYAQIVNGGVETRRFADAIGNFFPDYYRFLRDWNRIASGGLVARIFDRKRLIDGDVVSDFADALGLAGNTYLETPRFRNPSLGWRPLNFVRRVNRGLAKPMTAAGRMQAAEIKNRLRDIMSDLAGQYAELRERPIFPPGIVEAYQQRFIDSNRQVFSEFFHTDGWLFDPTWNGDSEWDEDEPLAREYVEQIIAGEPRLIEVLDFQPYARSSAPLSKTGNRIVLGEIPDMHERLPEDCGLAVLHNNAVCIAVKRAPVMSWDDPASETQPQRETQAAASSFVLQIERGIVDSAGAIFRTTGELLALRGVPLCSVEGGDRPPVEISGCAIPAIHRFDSSIGFWLSDLLPKIYAGDRLDGEAKVVIRANQASFVLPLLQMLGIGPERVVTLQPGEKLQAGRLIVPSDLHDGEHFDRAFVSYVDCLRSVAGADCLAAGSGQRLFIGNGVDASAELEALFAEFGFEPFNPSAEPFEAMRARLQAAEVLAGNGLDLAVSLLAPPAQRVLVIEPRREVSERQILLCGLVGQPVGCLSTHYPAEPGADLPITVRPGEICYVKRSLVVEAAHLFT